MDGFVDGESVSKEGPFDGGIDVDGNVLGRRLGPVSVGALEGRALGVWLGPVVGSVVGVTDGI